MKIVQILPELNEGGVERGIVEFNRELVTLGHESIVISHGGKLVPQIKLGGGKHIDFDVCSKNPLTALFRIWSLKKILKTLQPDIVHVRSRVPAWLTYFANKSLRLKIVSTVHGFNSVNFYSAIMTKADTIICVSKSIKEYIQKHYQVAEKKITIVPRGIDLEFFNPKKRDEDFIATFKKEHNLQDKFVVTTVGRVTQLKDYETFIKAIALLQDRYPDVIALMVGGIREDKQEYFKSLKKLIKEFGLQDRIIFAGSQAKINQIYLLSDVVVSSSKKPESFGRSVAEAIAMNKAVVATNHGGVKDIIQESINGYFFEIGDDKELAKKIILAKELKFNGYNYIRDNFSLEQMVEKTIGVYRSMI
ncbi:MAG: glycosyltransferase family 4 protein [Sulfurovaceae bacterium]